MSEYVTDTHALVWHLTAHAMLSAKARTLFVQADAGQHRIYVPSIALVELIYLIEKRRLEASLLSRVINLLNTPDGSYSLTVLDMAVAQTLATINRASVPDMPDRIIVATAKSLNLPLISRDPDIHRVGTLQVLW